MHAMTRAGMLRARRRWVKGRDIRRRSGELEALESGMADASSRLGTHAGEKGKPSPVNWGEERLTGGGFVSQWGFLYLAALAKPPTRAATQSLDTWRSLAHYSS